MWWAVFWWRWGCLRGRLCRFWGHERLDITYVLVNSVVMTVVFYFGLNPDETQMKLPD